MTPPLPAKVPTPFQGSKVALGQVANEHDVPAMPPISPIGPTPRYMCLTSKGDTAITARASLNPDFRLVVHSPMRVEVAR
jgi:hypothetical protein